MDETGGLIGSVVNLFGGIVGQEMAAQQRQQAEQRLQQAASGYDIPLPYLQQLQAQQLGPSAMEGLHADPSLEGAQYGALGELSRISDAGGMTLEDRVNNDQLQATAAQRAMAQRNAIQNLLSRQGVNPGSVGAAMQLGSANNQQEAAANAGAQTAGDARKRATQAVLDRARLAGQQRSQQFDEGARRAAARDAISVYNANARGGADRYNAGLSQQQFGNQYQLAQGRANALNNQANNYNAGADRTAATWANGAAGVGHMVDGIYSSATRGGGGGPSTTYGNTDTMSAPISLDPSDPNYGR